MKESLNVLIADDDVRFISHFKKLLEKELTRREIPYEIAVYTNTEDALKHEGYVHIAFLDIEMPTSEDGFEVARKMAAEHPYGLLIFVTAHESYVKQSFEVHPYEYLDKAELRSRVPSIITDCLTVLSQSVQHMRLPGTNIFVPVQSILYVRVDHNYCAVHLKDREQTPLVRSTLQWWEETYPQGMCCINRSYAINFHNIKHVEAPWITMEDDHKIRISQRKEFEILDKLNEYTRAWGRYL